MMPKYKEIPLLMGILNVTEDSFSDGSKYLETAKAIEHAKRMIAEGADIIDIGAESTRPGAKPLNPDLELQRLIPILMHLKEYTKVQISIDTRKSSVAKAAILAGADYINDVSALTFDPEMADVLAQSKNVKLVLMHMQGTPETMQLKPSYQDVLSEIYAFFAERIAFAKSKGIDQERIILDPGIGFGKNLEHNLDLIANLEYFNNLGCQLLLGASRKSFINMISPSAPDERAGGSLAAALYACLHGVNIIRIHDVRLHQQFFQVIKAIGKQERT